MDSPQLRSERLRAATEGLTLGFTHFLLFLAIQAESYLRYVYPTNERARDVVGFFARLAVSEGEPLLVSLALAGAYYVLRRQRFMRIVFFLAGIVLGFYLIIDQMIYGLFFDHFRVAMNDGQLLPGTLLLGAFVREINALTVVNFVLLAAIVWLLQRTFFRGRYFAWQERIVLARRGIICLVVYSLGSLFIARQLDLYNLDRHPAVVLAEYDNGSWKGAFPAPKLTPASYRLTYGTPHETATEKALIAKAAKKMRRSRKPNIVLVVLESVGSEQLFECGRALRGASENEGRLSPKFTPFLHSIEKHSIQFPNVYTIYPGTTMSHVPLMTGGYGLTWGSVFSDLELDYTAPTLVSELKRHGYATGYYAAGSLNGSNMDTYYHKLGFDKEYDFRSLSVAEQDAHRLSPWGGDENVMLDKAMEWVDTESKTKRPFLLEFMTISTHHPYVKPASFHGPLAGDGLKERYYNSIRYTDSVLEKLVADLKERNLLDDTLIFITGDHGQAFGDIHKLNFTHKNRIYEENIRTFLMVIDEKRIEHGPFIAPRIASNGDIMPTILAAAGLSPASVLGQNLFSPAYDERLVFFHKSTRPEQWGLRDGRWKFIGAVSATNAPAELYDLEKDPLEQENVAREHSEMVAAYHKRCSDWYFGMQAQYAKRVSGYKPLTGRPLLPGETPEPGPKILTIGEYDDRDTFHLLDTVPPFARAVLRTVWIDYPKVKHFRYEWISPSGKRYQDDLELDPGYTRTSSPLPAALPFETGPWTVNIWDGRTRLATKNFEVESPVPLDEDERQLSSADHPGPVLAVFGVADEADYFHASSNLQVDQKISALVVWHPFGATKRLRFEWTSPLGKVADRASFEIDGDEDLTTIPLHVKGPLEPGSWTFSVWDKKTKLISRRFVVSEPAVTAGTVAPRQ